MSSACATSRSRTRCATLPAPPSAATSPHRSAAAPPTWGAAQDVPPQALTASDSGSPGVMKTFVGAAMSGLRRPSSVGPSDEYDSGSSVVASNAATENAPRASPGVGELEAVTCAVGRQVHAAVERQPRRRRRARRAARRGSTCPAAGERARRHVGVGVGERDQPAGLDRRPRVPVERGRRQRGVRDRARAGSSCPGRPSRPPRRGRRPGGSSPRAGSGTRCRRRARRGCRRRRRRSRRPPSAACGSCRPS